MPHVALTVKSLFNESCVSCRPITGTSRLLATDQWTPWVSWGDRDDAVTAVCLYW